MSLTTTHCRASMGVAAPPVGVETHLGNGLPRFNIVGLPEKAVQEARERVRSALLNCGFEFPARRITVNLTPADLPKQGGRFDLAIAVGILGASGQVPTDALDGLELAGELTLGGDVRPVPGLLPVGLAAQRAGHRLALPSANAAEVALVKGLHVLALDHLLQLCEYLGNPRELPLAGSLVPQQEEDTPASPDLADVQGQPAARRALEICAAGRHNLLMQGPPGTGKSMLAQRLPGILPPMSEDEALQTAAVHSVAGLTFDARHWRRRPYRAPHHTTSGVALVGGGSHPRPGEISLAHNGVLFLDELPEFSGQVLDVLREPLETGYVHIARAARQAEYPADFQLVAAMNPCKCGYANDPQRRCAQCTPGRTARYQQRVSGPLRDRFDLLIDVPPLPADDILPGEHGLAESSATVAKRVAAAHQVQLDRQGCANARLHGTLLQRHCAPGTEGRQLLRRAMDTLKLSARALHRVQRIARTIADLEGADHITPLHLAEAVTYRRVDTG